MVVGSVSPPQLDLANEDLIRAHVQAIWLAESNESLGNSLTDILDVEGVKPTLDLLPSKKAGLSKADARTRALTVSNAVLDTIRSELTKEKAPGLLTTGWRSSLIRRYSHSSRLVDDGRTSSGQQRSRPSTTTQSSMTLLVGHNTTNQSDFDGKQNRKSNCLPIRGM